MHAVFGLACLATTLLRVWGHSWVSCTDYRGDMNYYQDEFCMSYPRGWDAYRRWNAFKADGQPNGLASEPKGYQMGRGFFDHEPCGINTRRRSSGRPPMMDDNACQRFHKTEAEGGSQFGERTTNGADYTDDFPAAIYEAGKKYCLAWPMKNHANAQCQPNGGNQDDTRLFFHPVKSNGKDPTITEFKRNNIRGKACRDAPMPRPGGEQCQLTAEFSGGWGSASANCKGYMRSPRYCENPDLSMGTGCFTVPRDLAPGQYHFMWFWFWVGNNDGSTCSNNYMTCWEAEVVRPGSPKARTHVTPGTKGAPNEVQDLGYSCKNDYSNKPDPAVPPAPTPPPTSAPPGRAPSPSRLGPSPPPWVPPPPAPPPCRDQSKSVCPGWARRYDCEANYTISGASTKLSHFCPISCEACPPLPSSGGDCGAQTDDSSVCSFYLARQGGHWTCDSTEALTVCNDVTTRYNLLCGPQKIRKYCPTMCGCANQNAARLLELGQSEYSLAQLKAQHPALMLHEKHNEAKNTIFHEWMLMDDDMNHKDVNREAADGDEDAWEEVEV